MGLHAGRRQAGNGGCLTRAAYGGFGPVFSLDGVTPTIAPDAFIAPTAAVIGDVVIGAETGIWFHCLVRGDMNVDPHRRAHQHPGRHRSSMSITGEFRTIIGDDVTVGHNAVIHACTLKNRAFVGISATVLDGAVIEEGGMLAAGGLLTPGKVIGPNEIVDRVARETAPRDGRGRAQTIRAQRGGVSRAGATVPRRG